MANRSVYWLLFPLLAILLTCLYFLSGNGIKELEQSVFINLGFLLFQLVLLTIYFSLKQKRPVNVTVQLLGLGDILFLCSIAFYLSVLNFLFFYISSLLGVLIVWMIVQLFSSKKNSQIPLAGFQAILLGVFLAGDWCWLHLNLTDDTWLLNLINR